MLPATAARRIMLAVTLAAHLGALIAVSGAAPRQEGTALLGLIALSWLTFLVAALVLARTPIARPVVVLAVVAAALQVPGGARRGAASTDSLRYVWDGRVQLSGTSPYRYPPTHPALAGLRDEILFPGGDPALNRPAIRTIYPPVAQLWFTAVAALTPWELGTLGVRIATAALAVAITVLLGWLLRRSGQDPRWAAVWGWCPLVLLEGGNNAHVDVLMTAFVVLAFAAQRVRRHGWAGVALGLAVGVKLVPLILVPVIAKERPARVGSAAAAVLALAYLPHVLAVGWLVFGYLPGYVEEELRRADRFAVLRVLLPDEWAVIVAVLIAFAAAALAARCTDPRRPWDAATWLVGLALLVACPPYVWYALLLLACVSLSGRWEWLAVAAAGYPVYLADAYTDPGHSVQEWSYGIAGLVVLVVTVIRRARAAPASAAASDSQINLLGQVSRGRHGLRRPR